jgi:hypothetical protein
MLFEQLPDREYLHLRVVLGPAAGASPWRLDNPSMLRPSSTRRLRAGLDRGGHGVTLMISPDIPPGYRHKSYADRWSLLRTTDNLLRLTCLAVACQRSVIGR